MGLDAMDTTPTGRKDVLKKKAIEEFKTFWIFTLYLWLFLGAFTVYRRLILAEYGITYLNYGIALIEALVIAKVILIGKMFGFTNRFDDKPLIVPVVYKSILFGILVLLFGVLEHLVEGSFHHKSVENVLRELAEIGAKEIAARVIVLSVAFVPFFAFWEIGRVLGFSKLSSMFFRRQAAPSAPGSDS